MADLSSGLSHQHALIRSFDETNNSLKTDVSVLMVTGTAAVNTALTITLPAVAGLFHYITSIQLMKLYNSIGVADGNGVIVTSTNLPGSPAWTTEQVAGTAGTIVTVINLILKAPLKSSVVSVATTLVAPVQLQTIWRANVTYFTGK